MNLVWFLPFLLFGFLFFTLPGFFLFEKAKINQTFWQKFFFGTITGYLLFTLVSYLFVVLNLDFLIIPIFVLMSIYFLKSRSFKLPKKIKLKKNLLILFVLAVGIISQLAVIAPSGQKVNGELLFWSSHGHDGAWHIALSNEIQKGFPLQNPEFAGERLVNYHMLSDIAPAMFNKHLKIPSLELYFRLFPFLYSLLLGASAYFLGQKIGKARSVGIWSVFFVYFAGSFGYIVTLLQNRGIGGESLFWGSQIQSSIGNPPFIVANIIVISFLYFFLQLQKKRERIIFFVCSLLLGSLAVLKIYAAIVLFGSLSIVGLWQIIKSKTVWILAMIFIAGILSLVLFLPYYSKTSSFLIFQPWWHVRTIIVEPSRLNWIDHELRRQTYIFEHNWKRVIFLESVGLSIFFFGNLGMRFIGLWQFGKYLKNSLKDYFKLTFVIATSLAFVFPLLFLQRGVAGGTANFLQYFILLFGFAAAVTISELTEKITNKFKRLFFIFLIVILAIPTQVGLLREFYSRPAFARISKLELEALDFISKNTNEEMVVLTPPYNQYLNLGGATPHIWDWFDTAYVAAFSSRRTFFDDYEQVDIMGYDFKERLEAKNKIFNSESAEVVKNEITSTRVDLVYFPKPLSPKVDLKSIGLIKLFENPEIEVWKVN